MRGHITKVSFFRSAHLFYIAFYPMVFAKAFGLNRSDFVYNILFAFSFLWLFIRIVRMKNLRPFVMMAALLVGCIFIFTHEMTMLYTMIFLIASKNIDFDKAMQTSAVLYVIGIILRLGLHFLGISEGGTKPMYEVINGVTVAVGTYSGYGFITPNVFFANVFMATILIFYSLRKTLNIFLISWLSLIIFIVYKLTHCRTGLLIYLIFVSTVVLFRYIDKGTRYIKYIFYSIVFLSLMIGVIFPLLYTINPAAMAFADRLFTGRLNLVAAALRNSGISLFGDGSSSLDILYMHTLINNGIVGFVLLLIGGYSLFKNIFKSGNLIGCTCVCAMILYASMEQFPLNIAMNPFILYLGTNVFYCKRYFKIDYNWNAYQENKELSKYRRK